MDKKKRRSSIKMISHDGKGNQDATVTNTTTKRRISFSGKKLIREFSGEEEPKNWNNCYELSDNINSSSIAEASNRVSSVNQSTNVASTSVRNSSISIKQKMLPSNDKENIQYVNGCKLLMASNRVNQPIKEASTSVTNSSISLKQKMLPSNDKENTQYVNECTLLGLNNSSHCNTKEFINITAQVDECKIENSADDITLSDKEREMQRQQQLGVKTLGNVAVTSLSTQEQFYDNFSNTSVRRSITFYGEESEFCKYDLVQLDGRDTLHCTNMDISQESNAFGTLRKIKQNNGPIKQATNTGIEFIKNDQVQLDGRVTLHCTNMDISQESNLCRTILMNKHIDETEKNNLKARRTDHVPVFMDESRTALCRTRDSLAAYKSTTIQQTLDMDISAFATKLEALDSKDKISAALQEKDDSCVLDIDTSLQAELSPKRRTTYEQLDLAQETINFTNKLNNFSLTKDSDASAEMKRNEHYQTIAMNLSINKSKNDLHKTINFNSDIKCDMAPATAKAIGTQRRATLIFKSDDACSQMDVTTANIEVDAVTSIPMQNQTPLQLFKSSTTKKDALPKVVVVRKTCTPIMQNRATVNDMEKRQMQRYQQKQQQQRQAIYEATTEEHVAAIKEKSNIANFSEILSPELSSPLFPPEIITASSNKKLNFRQLNDDIEHGKIQIRSNAIVPKVNTPLPERKSRNLNTSVSNATTRNNSHCKAKQSLALNFEGTMQFSQPDINNHAGANKSTQNIQGIAELEVITKPVNVQKRREFRYSQADDMLLDNTIFLTQAKLGDETASRNSSKCSTANKRDTIHFNYDLELELNEVEAKRTALALASNLEVNNGLCLDLTDIHSSELTKSKIVNTKENESKCDSRKLLASNKSHINNETLCSVMPEEFNNETLKLSAQSNNVTVAANIEMDCNISFKENEPLQDYACNTSTNKRQTIYAVELCALDEENITKAPTIVAIDNKNNTTSIQNDTIEMDCSVLTKKCKQLENVCNNTNNRRQTVYTAEPCELEEEYVTQPAIMMRRETLYFNSAINEETQNLRQTNQPPNAENETNNIKNHQTLHFTNDCNNILIDESFTYKTKINNTIELDKPTDKYATNPAIVITTQKSRPTMHFTQDNNSMMIDESVYYKSKELHETDLQHQKEHQESLQNLKSQASKFSRATLHFSHDNDMLIDNSFSDNRLKTTNPQRKDTDRRPSESLLQNNRVNDRNKISALCVMSDVSSMRIETIKDNNNERLSKSAVSQTTNENMHIDESLRDNEKTLQQLSLKDEQNSCAVNKTIISSAVKPLNAAKLALKRQSAMTCKSLDITADDSLILKLEETRAATVSAKKMKSPTPATMLETSKWSLAMPTTPHRSIIEFEYFEREANLDQENSDLRKSTRRQTTYECTDIKLDVSGLQPIEKASDISNMCMSPDLDAQSHSNKRSGLQPIEKASDLSNMCMSPDLNAQSYSNKRSTANLTPNLPVSKKRQTLVFDNLNLEESLALHNLQNINKTISSHRRTLVVPSDMDIDQSNIVNECDLNNIHNGTLRKKSISLSTTNSRQTHWEDQSVICTGEYIQNDPKEKQDKSGNETMTVNLITTENEQLNKNFEIEKTPPSKQQTLVSRIPVLIDSAKKINSILARFQSPNKLDKTDINHSLETIEMPRRATLFKKRADSILPIPISMNKNEDHSSFLDEHKKRSTKSIFEDNPITISDVSAYYVEQRQSAANNEAVACTYDLNAEEYQQTNQAESKFAILNEDNTVNNLANYKKNFLLHLTCSNSPMIGSDEEDIEKTRLSLVETLLDDDDDDDGDDTICDIIDNKSCNIDQVDKCSDKLSEEQQHLMLVSGRKSLANHSLRNVSFCRKCKRCQETLVEETNASVDESFVLPPLPPMPDLGFERLRRLRKRPTIADVQEYWRRKSLERSFNYDDDEDEDQNNDDIEKLDLGQESNTNSIINKYKQEREKMETEFAEKLRMPLAIRETFAKRLDTLLSQKLSNWIFDDQMQYRNLFKFSHRKHLTFALIITYEEIDSMGCDIHIKSIERTNRRAPIKNWLPINFMLNFQLTLELPYDIKTLCPSDDVNGVFDMLKKVNKICVNVAKMGRQLWLYACSQHASLIVDSNRVYVQKILREVMPATADAQYAHVVKTEFRIEITNIRKVCWKDIALPPLHMFREEIQFLPIGLDFLQAFLPKPKDYLKI